MTDDQIKHMVNRFLSWKLPENWHPDGGISYQRPNYHPSIDATPTGTNLFDYTQAEAMVRHMAEGSPLTGEGDPRLIIADWLARSVVEPRVKEALRILLRQPSLLPTQASQDRAV